MNVNSPQQQLHAESFAADVLNQSCILFMDRVHDSVYGKRVFIAEFLKPDIRLRGCEITIGVFMQPVFHLNGKAPRYIGINGVEGVKYDLLVKTGADSVAFYLIFSIFWHLKI